MLEMLPDQSGNHSPGQDCDRATDRGMQSLLEQQLRESDARFVAFMDHLPGYAWMKDLGGRLVYINRVMKEFPEFAGGWQGKTDSDLWPAEIAAEYRGNDLKVIETKKPLQTVEPYMNEGQQRYVLVSKFPIFDQDGEVRMVAGVSFDITDRMEAEKALRAREVDLAEAQRLGKIGSWRFDLESGAVTWSDELYRIFGISRSGVLTYGSFLNRVHPEDRELVSGTSARARERGTDFDIEYRIILEDGEQKIIREEGFVSKDVHGKIKQLFGVAQDITERKEAEKALRKANRQLKNISQRRIREQEEERRRLSRELHDQIGQSLTAAKITVEGMRDASEPELLTVIDETTGILDDLLNQVRQISLDLRPLMLDDLGLVPALRSLLDQHRRRASVKVCLSAENIPENLDPEIQTTCFRIAQEAITNAVRHAKSTQIGIELLRENGVLLLQVRDDGRGFDPESIQAQTEGLGLIGMKERAALVDGQVKVLSSPNNGTTVELTIPLASRSKHRIRSSGK